MDHNELFRKIDTRLDKIESKLDQYLEISAKNDADIAWIKGYIKISVTALIALGGTLISLLLK